VSKIAILSVNHQLAPVEVRERVAFSPNELSNALLVQLLRDRYA
jgi:glutamyl-tRNA reductase